MNARTQRCGTKWIVTAAALALLVTTPASAQSWVAPRTSWGVPDVSGHFTNKYELGTPMERPEELAGRRIEDIKGDELAAILLQRQQSLLLGYAFTGGDPAGGSLGAPNYWADRFEIAKGSLPWMLLDPPDGKMPALTAAAQKRAAQGGRGDGVQRVRTAAAAAKPTTWEAWRDQLGLSLYDRCITRGYPGTMMPVSYGNSYHILQTPDYVTIRYEMIHDIRIVPLDGRPHAPQNIRQYMGDARGRYEGDSLVIETTNLRTGFRGSNPATTRIVERFTRTGPNRVQWTVTIEDPSTWTRPWTYSLPLSQDEKEAIQEYACHEGNLSMPLRLSVARQEEIAIEEAAGKGVTVERQSFKDEEGNGGR